MRMSAMVAASTPTTAPVSDEQVRNAIDQPTRTCLLVWEDMPSEQTHFYAFVNEADIQMCVNAHTLFVGAMANTDAQDAHIELLYRTLELRDHCKLSDDEPMCIPIENGVIIVCYAGFCA